MKILNLVREIVQVCLDLTLMNAHKFQSLPGDIICYQLDLSHQTLNLNGLIFRLKLTMNWLIILETYTIEFYL